MVTTNPPILVQSDVRSLIYESIPIATVPATTEGTAVHLTLFTTMGSIFFLLFVAALAIFLGQTYSSSKLFPVHDGDTVLVTGSSSGIGKHAALSLVREGYTVFACVRKANDGEALVRSAQEFELDTSLLRPIILDVTNSSHIQSAVQTISEFVGDRGLKGLFNNAGVSMEVPKPASSSRADSTSVEFMPISTYRTTFDVNYFGLVETTQAFLPLLRKAGGRIIMNTSLAGFLGTYFMSAYVSSKFAVEGFSDALRRELLPHGVAVSILEPGFVMTPILSAQIPEGKEPYRNDERRQWKRFFKGSLSAPPPKVTSDAVLHAMRSQSPRTRYRVGKGSFIYWLAAQLPARWLDYLMVYGPAESISDEGLLRLAEANGAEFEL